MRSAERRRLGWAAARRHASREYTVTDLSCVSDRQLTPVINRTLHTYHSTLRILCQSFQIDTEGLNFRCEGRLIEEAHRINHSGKMLVPIIDDAHLTEMDALRRLRNPRF